MISKPQRIKFFRELWPAVCKAYQWHTGDDDKRYGWFAEILGHVPRHARTLTAGQHISISHLDNSDFDLVIAQTGKLQDNVAATIETDHPELGERRRLLNNIEDHLHELAICLDAINSRSPRREEGDSLARARAYLSAIIKKRFPGHTDPETLSPEPQLRDNVSLSASGRGPGRGGPHLGPSELERCLYALRTALNAKRNQAEISVKEMQLLARNLQPF